MHGKQGAFEELTAHHHVLVEQDFFPESFGTNVCTHIKRFNAIAPASIDDFLAHYTLEPSVIRDIISGVEEPAPQCSFCGYNARHEIMTEEERLPSMFYGSPGNAVVHVQGRAIKASGDHKIGKAQEKESATIRKRIKLSPEKREERRRDQNREAQRRFREKHLHLPQQNSWNTPPPNYCLERPGFLIRY